MISPDKLTTENLEEVKTLLRENPRLSMYAQYLATHAAQMGFVLGEHVGKGGVYPIMEQFEQIPSLSATLLQIIALDIEQGKKNDLSISGFLMAHGFMPENDKDATE